MVITFFIITAKQQIYFFFIITFIILSNLIFVYIFLTKQNKTKKHNKHKSFSQNTTKIAEIKIAVDARENEKSMELKHIFENKLYAAELNREKELQKKLDPIRKHVRVLIKYIFSSFLNIK